jgi:hypothetical protein
MKKPGAMLPVWHLLVLLLASVSSGSSQELVTDDEVFAIGESR